MYILIKCINLLSGIIMDYKVCERIALTYSKSNDLMWSCSRQSIKLLKENTTDSTSKIGVDISVIIRRRASLDYGLKVNLKIYHKSYCLYYISS